MKFCKVYMICSVAVAMSLSAQGLEQNQENTIQAIKVKELNLRKENLQKQIRIEDRKRNLVVNGVTAETQEMLNDRQDSICLELRSQLVSVELELRELVPDKTAAVIAGQLNIMNQNHQQQSEQNSNGETSTGNK